MKKRTVEMALLLDFYGELLTEKQREYMDLYYNEDFSLAEIAQLGGLTRQGVRDTLVRGENTLLETERKTGLLGRFGEVSETASRIKRNLTALEKLLGDTVSSPLFSEIYRDLDALSR